MLYRISAGLEFTRTGSAISWTKSKAVVTEALEKLVTDFGFGGASATRCKGVYRHEDGRIVHEVGVTFEVYTDPYADSRRPTGEPTDSVRIAAFAVWLRNELDQEAVIVASVAADWRLT